MYYMQVSTHVQIDMWRPGQDSVSSKTAVYSIAWDRVSIGAVSSKFSHAGSLVSFFFFSICLQPQHWGHKHIQLWPTFYVNIWSQTQELVLADQILLSTKTEVSQLAISGCLAFAFIVLSVCILTYSLILQQLSPPYRWGYWSLGNCPQTQS